MTPSSLLLLAVLVMLAAFGMAVRIHHALARTDADLEASFAAPVNRGRAHR